MKSSLKKQIERDKYLHGLVSVRSYRIELHPRNFNRKAGLMSSSTWQLLISILECSIQQVIDSKARCNHLLTWPMECEPREARIPSRAHVQHRSTHHTAGHISIRFSFTKPSVAP